MKKKISGLSRGKGPKASRQDFRGRGFEIEASNKERYFPVTLQPHHGQSKLVRIFWIRPLKRTT